ncbi:MAG: hypothetical protein WC797_00820 [Candidatus Paceibacterota bacterium]|jgi:hypothetical protein
MTQETANRIRFLLDVPVSIALGIIVGIADLPMCFGISLFLFFVAVIDQMENVALRCAAIRMFCSMWITYTVLYHLLVH